MPTINNLLTIRNQVRLITLSLSETRLSTQQLDNYINRFILYDFPETLRLLNLKTTVTFYTLPYVDTYSTTTNPASPLYDFSNKYITTNAPVYIAGFNCLFSQDRSSFYGQYPFLNSVSSIGQTGNGIQQQFTGVINTTQTITTSGTTQYAPLLRNQVLFDSIDVNYNGLAMVDSPILDSVTGNQTNFGLLYNSLTTNQQPVAATNVHGIPVLSFTAPYRDQPNFPSSNYINYVTGEYVVTFPTAPQAGAAINSQTVQVQPSMPKSVLFYNGAFVVRPVPDQSYRVDIEVFQQPSELLQVNDVPELAEWCDFIAYGAALKVFESRMDYDSIAMIAPSLKRYEDLINRRTVQQLKSQQVATIFDKPKAYGYWSGWNNGGSGIL